MRLTSSLSQSDATYASRGFLITYISTVFYLFSIKMYICSLKATYLGNNLIGKYTTLQKFINILKIYIFTVTYPTSR